MEQRTAQSAQSNSVNDPNAAADRKVEGSISNLSNSTLSLRSQNLDHGKWVVNPPASLPPQGSATFLATGREATGLGVEGTIVYTTEDGATFNFYFNDPYTQENSATITCSGTACGNYLPSVSQVPPGGHVISPAYTINSQR
jgi:hypothetical protein